MVKLIVGSKGSGKTKKMVDELNRLAAQEKNVVCIEPGRRLDESVKYTIRLVDITEYPVHGYQELLGFVAGISAKDYDLDEIYIDSLTRVANSENMEEMAEFLVRLDAFVKDKKFNANIMLSAEVEELPESVRAFLV